MKRTNTLVEMLGNRTKIQLILHIPNNKNISNINEVPFYKQFVKFYGMKVTPNIIKELEDLKREIELYCKDNEFFTENGETALELSIIIFRN